MTNKVCTKCNLSLSLDFFRFRKNKQKYDASCKSCNNKLYRSSREMINASAKRRYKENPEKHQELRIASTAKIPVSKYRELKNLYGTFCNICGTVEKVGGKSLAYDHDHKTKVFRGFLCLHCNQGLGKFFDNIELLEKAIKYLSRSK